MFFRAEGPLLESLAGARIGRVRRPRRACGADVLGIEALLETPEVVVEDADLARRALADWQRGLGDFADCFIFRRNERSGCQTTLSFDKALARNAPFGLP